ncbi:MAG: MerR family transcriptional regulator [Dehalococcoidia bacterium]|nr:MerR family transcriptional regulator [Dehalococcoidia bacterium]
MNISMGELFGRDEPVFVISVAARMCGVRTQTLRYYETLGLVTPARTRGNQRVFSRRDIDRVRRVRNLVDDLGVNLAGVEVILRLLGRIEEAERRVAELEEENRSLRAGADRRRLQTRADRGRRQRQ